ncbi:MFS transporter [Amycolatopsis sp. NPDC052450]|uniref:MFS transporter n=1 Tax=Amycolatopsis sp. NPDC052450 TaxID=3363937 RepID=UPI0037C6AF7A
MQESRIGNPGAGPQTRGNRRLIGLVAVLVLVNFMVDTAITAPLLVLPEMLDHFGTDQTAWLNASAMLAGVMWAPLLGKSADVHGKRKVLVLTLLLSCAGALICAARIATVSQHRYAQHPSRDTKGPPLSFRRSARPAIYTGHGLAPCRRQRGCRRHRVAFDGKDGEEIVRLGAVDVLPAGEFRGELVALDGQFGAVLSAARQDEGETAPVGGRGERQSPANFVRVRELGAFQGLLELLGSGRSEFHWPEARQPSARAVESRECLQLRRTLADATS